MNTSPFLCRQCAQLGTRDPRPSTDSPGGPAQSQPVEAYSGNSNRFLVTRSDTDSVSEPSFRKSIISNPRRPTCPPYKTPGSHNAPLPQPISRLYDTPRSNSTRNSPVIERAEHPRPSRLNPLHPHPIIGSSSAAPAHHRISEGRADPSQTSIIHSDIVINGPAPNLMYIRSPLPQRVGIRRYTEGLRLEIPFDVVVGAGRTWPPLG